MPKSFSHLWEQVIDFENLYHAFRAASTGKRYRWESLKFKNNLEENLITLQNELIWNTYKPQPYRHFIVHEPKQRLISTPTFRDRVVHHALCQVIEPIFENRFISETFACRRGKGTNAAVDHVQKCARAAQRKWGTYYVLKCDIKSFFPSVDHAVLKKILQRFISDEKVMNLIDGIIRSYESPVQDGKGIPIGALTSQLFANIDLSPFDHWIKEDNHLLYYARYMDDFVILHHDKPYLFELLCKIENYIHDTLKMNLNPKTGIFPAKQGIDFCGYRIWAAYIKPRKSTIKRAKKRFKQMPEMYKKYQDIFEHAKMSMMSFLGYIRHCQGWRSTKSVLEKIVFRRD
ncbi:MAG: reverse transcriptase/maturase family protein [Proteiniphilum sp.]|jgi:retron-type reverse transcriptase|nr:reverse transcriptase/maturase family protein [Proteiniphilum sp.]